MTTSPDALRLSSPSPYSSKSSCSTPFYKSFDRYTVHIYQHCLTSSSFSHIRGVSLSVCVCVHVWLAWEGGRMDMWLGENQEQEKLSTKCDWSCACELCVVGSKCTCGRRGLNTRAALKDLGHIQEGIAQTKLCEVIKTFRFPLLLLLFYVSLRQLPVVGRRRRELGCDWPIPIVIVAAVVLPRSCLFRCRWFVLRVEIRSSSPIRCIRLGVGATSAICCSESWYYTKTQISHLSLLK